MFRISTKRWGPPSLILCGSLLLTWGLGHFEFTSLEAKLYDFRMRMGNNLLPSQDIVVITVDDASAAALGDTLPLSAERQLELLKTIQAGKPKAIGWLLNPDAEPVTTSPYPLKNFVQTALNDPSIPFILGTRLTPHGEGITFPPVSSLQKGVAPLLQDEGDSTTRRLLLSWNHFPSFHQQLAEAANSKLAELKNTYEMPGTESQYAYFRYHVDPLDSDLKHQHYAEYSLYDVIKTELPKDTFNGKIILVGQQAHGNSNDFALTPYSRTPFVTPAILLHANMVDSILYNNLIYQLSPKTRSLLVFLVSIIILTCVVVLTPVQGVFVTVSIAASLCLMSQMLFSHANIWLPLAHPLLAIFLGYYLTVPYRLLLEFHARWDLEQQAEVKSQVEELKTNFLSLVTHDLKTPVARIQGLAEVLRTKAATRLEEKDNETLGNILTATEDLNGFINNLLELNRIESKRLQLCLESKDINQLIETAIHSIKPKIKSAELNLSVNLEPLFPIHIDANLIGKVINTLLDNAIKYSKPHSEIIIRSKEHDSGHGEGFIIIEVEDHGIGMSPEEQQHLFTRFYRAKNPATEQVKGSGLGLYLTRYFIEMHHGDVSVQSEKAKGSIFKIRLPLKQPATQKS